MPHEPDLIRDSIRMTESHKFDRIPATHDGVLQARRIHPHFKARRQATTDESGPFFRHLITTVPAIFGRQGPDEDDGAPGQHASKHLPYDLDDEIAYTRRCRKLSTYTQITTLLSTCRLSRLVAQRRIHNESECSWPLHRSLGPLYRPRPMDVWEAHYDNNKAPSVINDYDGVEVLAPRIHALDLAVFRLHDSQGRATPLLQQAAWQYGIETRHGTTFACFDRIGIEWHPSWATVGGRGELRPGNVQAVVHLMQMLHSSFLYWMVDGVPRPNWGRDYPAVVREIFDERMRHERIVVLDHLGRHWKQSREEREAMLADHHLGQEFEANGRRYYIVFVVLNQFDGEPKARLRAAGVGHRGPFPGRAELWPEAIREPVRLAWDVMSDGSRNMGACPTTSYILSWEPI